MAYFVRAIVPLTISARLALLLGVLALVAAVWIYDYALARPAVAVAYRKIAEFVDSRNRIGVNRAALVTAADIHQAIGMQPTWVDRHHAEQYEVEYYCWWGRVPFVSTRRHYLAVVYVGENPRHFSSHYQNEPPPQDALPMPADDIVDGLLTQARGMSLP